MSFGALFLAFYYLIVLKEALFLGSMISSRPELEPQARLKLDLFEKDLKWG